MAENTIYFSEAFLVQMRTAIPAHLSFDDLIAACQRPLRRSARVNALKISVADSLSLVTPYGWQLTPVPWCEEGLWIERNGDDVLPLGGIVRRLSRLFRIQEASSVLPVTTLFAGNPQPERAMDVTAVPGPRTTQIATQIGNAGGILANELSASRVKVLHTSISCCDISNAALTHFDDRAFGAALPEAFDAILLDAPYSGEGVVRKDTDALKNWLSESNLDIAAAQHEPIDNALYALYPGGTLVYSTCTLNREENQSVVQWLLSRYPQVVEILPLGGLFSGTADALTAEGLLHVLPQIYDCEGFSVARLRKTVAIDLLLVPGYKVGKFPSTSLKSREAAAVTAAASAVGLVWGIGHTLWQRDRELWLLPQTTELLFGQIRFSRIGTRLAEVYSKRYRWQHEAVIAFAAPQRALELTQEEAEEWYRGRGVYPQTTPQQDEAIVTFQGVPLGLAKRVGSRLKNSCPHELARDGKLFTGKV